jgi:hypothetical protein
MPNEQFEALRLELLRGGVAPVYVERTLQELDEHLCDLADAARTSGCSHEEALRIARATLGDERTIAAAILCRRELLAWSVRHPLAAHCLQSAMTIGTLPGLPLLYCIEHRPELARYGAALGLATVLVGGVLAGLNWLIYVV